jgi:hypothetical protein
VHIRVSGPLFGYRSAGVGDRLIYLALPSSDAGMRYSQLLSKIYSTILPQARRKNSRFLPSTRRTSRLPCCFSPLFLALRGRLPRLDILALGPFCSARVLGDAFQHAPRLRALELFQSAKLLELEPCLPLTQIKSIRFNASRSGYHLVSLQNLISMVTIQSVPSGRVGVPLDPPALQRLTAWRVEFAEPPKASSGQEGPLDVYSPFRSKAGARPQPENAPSSWSSSESDRQFLFPIQDSCTAYTAGPTLRVIQLLHVS